METSTFNLAGSRINYRWHLRFLGRQMHFRLFQTAAILVDDLDFSIIIGHLLVYRLELKGAVSF